MLKDIVKFRLIPKPVRVERLATTSEPGDIYDGLLRVLGENDHSSISWENPHGFWIKAPYEDALGVLRERIEENWQNSNNMYLIDSVRYLTGIQVRLYGGLPSPLSNTSWLVELSMGHGYRLGDGQRFYTHAGGWEFIQQKGIHSYRSRLKIRNERK